MENILQAHIQNKGYPSHDQPYRRMERSTPRNLKTNNLGLWIPNLLNSLPDISHHCQNTTQCKNDFKTNPNKIPKILQKQRQRLITPLREREPELPRNKNKKTANNEIKNKTKNNSYNSSNSNCENLKSATQYSAIHVFFELRTTRTT